MPAGQRDLEEHQRHPAQIGDSVRVRLFAMFGGMVMSPDDDLRQLVATLLMVPVEEVGPETSLSSLHTSFDRVKLGLGLKRLGLSLTSESWPATFGGLQRA